MDRRNFLALGGLAAVTASRGRRRANRGGQAAGGRSIRAGPAAHAAHSVERRSPPGRRARHLRALRSRRRRVGARTAARSAAVILFGRRHADRHLAHVFHRRSGARRPADARAAGQGVHRHQGVDAGLGRRGRAEGRRADAALDGAAEAPARRAHAGAQPGGRGRAPAHAAPLEGRGPHQVPRRDALHHQLLSRPDRASSSARNPTSCSSTTR